MFVSTTTCCASVRPSAYSDWNIPKGLKHSPAPDPEVILRDLDTAFGFAIHFPNPYPDEVGLKTSRGVASYRAVQGLYQAYRVAELVRDRPAARVVEIGGGLGRTAFYA